MFHLHKDRHGKIFFGAKKIANSDKVSQANERGQQTMTRREKKAKEQETAQNNRHTALPTEVKQKTIALDITKDDVEHTTKKGKYGWHLVLNHASPDVLTKLAGNPAIKDESLEDINTFRHDMICRPWMEMKTQ